MTLPPDSVIIVLLAGYALFLAVYLPYKLRKDERARRAWWAAVQEQEKAAHARDLADADDRRRRTPNTDQEM